MNKALFFLWLSLLKHRSFYFITSLRRPVNLIGFFAVATFLGGLFYYRHEEIFAHSIKPQSLFGGAMIMLGGSFFKGFLQRGLVFDPPDIEFLLTSPFTQRQLVLYRMLPNYLYAVVQAVVFVLLFAPHLHYPLVTFCCVTLFQIGCFHVAAAAAIYAGSVPEPLHYRLRWMLLGIYFLFTALYLRIAWDLKLLLSFVSSPSAQLLFYPALTLSDLNAAPLIQQWARYLATTRTVAIHQFWQPSLYLLSFTLAAVLTLWLLLKLRINIFETAPATSTRVAEKRHRLRHGQHTGSIEVTHLRSSPLPRLAMFHGVGAILWKNLLVAKRSRRELLLAFAFTVIFTAPLASLLWLYHHYISQGAQMSLPDTNGFHTVVALMLGFLPFLLQRTFPFDFRRDGPHIVGFRTLPVSPLALVLAQISVPTLFCLAFQALGVCALMVVARLPWPSIFLIFLGFPAIALALNSVWNLHYLLSATKRASGRSQSNSPVALLLVVALSFLVFYPAGWTAMHIGKYFSEPVAIPMAAAAWLAVQYAVDLILVLILARLFHRFEVSREG